MRIAAIGLAAVGLLALAPVGGVAEAARGDARQPVASKVQQSRAAAVSTARPAVAVRPPAARPAVASAPGRGPAARGASAPPRQTAVVPARGGNARAAAAPAGSRNLAAQARGQRGNTSRMAALVAPPRNARGGAFAAVPYARHQPHQAAVNPLRQTAMAACTVRNGRRVCGPVMRTVALRWTQGGNMPAPTLAQTTCPDGTIATTALGHTDVVRCVPM